MWISKYKLRNLIHNEIELYMNKYGEQLYLKNVEDIQKYATSTEFLLQIVEVINKMQIPEPQMSQEERNMLT